MSTTALPRSKSTGGILSPPSHPRPSARPLPARHHPRAITRPSPPSASPLLEREDPFSLAGFFPTQRSASVDHFGSFAGSHGISARRENAYFQWTHRISAEEEEDEEVDEVESPVDDLWRGKGVMCDDGGVVGSEDKLGILAFDSEEFSRRLGGVFSASGLADERLLSPYSEDDPVDDESLCNALRARRKAQTQPPSPVAAHRTLTANSNSTRTRRNVRAKTVALPASQSRGNEGERFRELFLSPAASTQSSTGAGWYRQVQNFVDAL